MPGGAHYSRGPSVAEAFAASILGDDLGAGAGAGAAAAASSPQDESLDDLLARVERQSMAFRKPSASSLRAATYTAGGTTATAPVTREPSAAGGLGAGAGVGLYGSASTSARPALMQQSQLPEDQ